MRTYRNSQTDTLSQQLKKISYREFVESGRANTIKKRVVIFLYKNSNRSYTASELVELLMIKCRSSICAPLVELIELGLIEVVGERYDENTKRPVGTYQIVDDCLNSINLEL